ncbi:hypothetical protein Mal15_31080 [Stieleria maiorica]|uniref:Uncharacterized protein n=1 Tax=Stieleria maiorica TaxID=2795974 RepID=A0A5B9MEU8_9BACT|nr:hypothetical protein [Stieleria maiorica]QEF99049.1 hypothetical protein Mal15_31080 [Stieleria maiorica]
MPGKSQQKRPQPRAIPRGRRSTTKRLATSATLALAALTSAAGIHSIPDARADHPATLQRVGRLLGVGWGDGYHVCRDGGCRPGADLPPHGFPDQFGHKRCADGCGQIYPAGTALPQVRHGLPHLLTGLPKLPPVSGPAVYSAGVAPCHSPNRTRTTCDDAACDVSGCDYADEIVDAPNALAGPETNSPPNAPPEPSSAVADAPLSNIQQIQPGPAVTLSNESDESMALPPDWMAGPDPLTDPAEAADRQLQVDSPAASAAPGPKAPQRTFQPEVVASPSDETTLLDLSPPTLNTEAASEQSGEPDLLNDPAYEQRLPPAAHFRGIDDLGTVEVSPRDASDAAVDIPVQLRPIPQDPPQPFATPPVRSNPYIGSGHRNSSSQTQSAAPRVATLPGSGANRDWNPIRQPE